MLESVNFSIPSLKKEDYKPQRDELMEKLVVLQQQAREHGVGLVVLFEGWNGAGKGSRISDLMYCLDARATTVHVTENYDAKAGRAFAGRRQGVHGFFPLMQEFWKSLGPRGDITFYDRGWYTTATQHLLSTKEGEAFLEEVKSATTLPAKGKKGKENERTRFEAEAIKQAGNLRKIDAVQRYLTSTADFERQLTADGYVVVKFFVHIRKKVQRKRLEGLWDDPATRWRVDENKLARIANYEEAYRIYDTLLEGSDYEFAPWHLINGEDKRAANLAIAQTLIDAIQGALDAQPDAAAQAAAAKAQANSAGKLEEAAQEKSPEQVAAEAKEQADQAHLLAPKASRFTLVEDPPTIDGVDHSLVLDEETYRKELKREQKKLAELELEMYLKRVPLIIMYEGWDAAGKGGNIKRIAQALDARAYTIFPSPAPTKPELLHPHLWRYWTRLPKAGHVGIYDRSWYGRVLVERVEGFATPEEWGRAYDEINEYERDLVQWGAILLKFWVDVSPDEQLRRFQDRQNDPAKQWKITDEDWRNRDKYPQYKSAIDDMFRLTSTTYAPWMVLESDDKRYARLKALKIVNEVLEARLRES